MPLTINRRRVLIFAPAAYTTGGVELLHQLTHQLNFYSTIDAKILYFNKVFYFNNIQNIQPKIYTQRYNTSYLINTLPADTNSILIFPQVVAYKSNNPMFLPYNKIIYWESVDNYYYHTPQNQTHIFPENVLHLVQSEYAKDHLLKLNIPIKKILSVTDYLSQDFLKLQQPSLKQNIVLYNPNKDMSFTQKIILQGKEEIKFIPLQNLSTKEMINLMQKSKVYIDFGNHPGKQRIPREAAMCDCCLIIGNRGSAINTKDVSIPLKYKYDCIDQNIKIIINHIKNLFITYNTAILDFKSYKQNIKKEPEIFKQEVKEFVDKLTVFQYNHTRV